MSDSVSGVSGASNNGARGEGATTGERFEGVKITGEGETTDGECVIGDKGFEAATMEDGGAATGGEPPNPGMVFEVESATAGEGLESTREGEGVRTGEVFKGTAPMGAKTAGKGAMTVGKGAMAAGEEVMGGEGTTGGEGARTGRGSEGLGGEGARMGRMSEGESAMTGEFESARAREGFEGTTTAAMGAMTTGKGVMAAGKGAMAGAGFDGEE